MTRRLIAMLLAAGAMLGAWADYKAEVANGYTWIYEQEGEESFIVGIAETPSGTLLFPAELGGKPVRNLVGHGYGSFGKYQWLESEWHECGGYWWNDWNVSNDWLGEVTKLVIPEGVTNIYDRVFQANYWVDGETGLRHCYGWFNLNEVELPDTLKSCVIRDVFCNTPYSLSDDIAELVLSKSGRKLYGIKVYGKEYDWDAKYLDVIIPETIVEIADYALPYIVHVAWRDEYGNPSGCSGCSMGTITKRRHIVFAGAKPKSSDMAFADWDTDWDEERGEVVRLYKIRGDAVYYHEGASGWTWGEEWCGVKTYALDELPGEWAVESDLKLGHVYAGEMGSDHYGPYHAISGRSDVTLCDEEDEYALIPVTGAGRILPVIFGDVPAGCLDSPQVWTDQKLFDTFTPKGVPPSRWEDNDDGYWEYEESNSDWEWPKGIWPDNKPVANRRWIVIHAKNQGGFGIWTFRVGLSGTSEITDSVILVRNFNRDKNYEKSNLSPSDFIRGISISGYDTFSPFDYCEASVQSFEIENHGGKPLSFNVVVPSAGTLVVAGETDDEDSLAMKNVFSVKGNSIVFDIETVNPDNWELPDSRWNTTNYWKASFASHIRRIEVSGKTTLTFKNLVGDDQCEFNRMYFFPKDRKSVAVDSNYIMYEETSGENGTKALRHCFQGCVTGGGVYKSGETVTLRTVSGDGEIFDHWEVQFGNLTLTEAQKRNPTLSFTVTDAMCGEMEDEEQIFISAIWKPKYKVTALPSIVGAGTVTGTGRYHEGTVVTLTATAAEGCTFVKWSDGETSPTRQVAVVAADVERVLYACFDAPNGVPMANESGVSATELYEAVDGAVPTAAASVYDGYLVDAKGNVAGSIQVKVGKPKAGLASVKATVVVGVTKSSLKGADNGKAAIAANGPTTMRLVGGESCEVTLGAEGLSGTYGSYQIDGARNFFSSKDKGEQGAANGILEKWIGAVNVVWSGGTVSVSIGKKGKTKVAVTLADGTKATANAQLLVGEEWLCVPVVVTKKMNLVFTLWLPSNGGAALVDGLSGDVVVGKPGALAANAAFRVGKSAALWQQIPGTVLTDYLPDGMAVTQSGTKWTLPKAGKVVYKDGAVDESKLGENPCGLKLTYKAKDGSFKGSFKVYAEVKGKPKATTVSVTGFLLNGVGYGTATIKKVGSVPIEIQ